MQLESREGQQPKRVLIVEDESVWQDLYKRMLEPRGIQVTTASGVKEALELLENGNFDRIITDGLEGGWIRIATRAQEIGLPVKLVSGDSRHREHAESIGVEFINKSEVAKKRDQL